MANLNIQRASTGNLSLPDTSHRIKIDSLKTQFLQNTSQQLTTVENQITELKDQIEQANIQLKNNIIIAPETGTIHLNSEFEGKSLILMEVRWLKSTQTSKNKGSIHYLLRHFRACLIVKRKARCSS